MRNPERDASGDTIKVTIGMFGSTPQEYDLAEDTIVSDALGAAGLEYTSGNIFVNGSSATNTGILDDGDVINVVTSKQGG